MVLKTENQNFRNKKTTIPDEYYQVIVNSIKGSFYKQVRLRIAFFLLAITGISVKKLLFIKVGQLESLIENKFILIRNNSKKIFLSEKGKQVLKERKDDFILFKQYKTSPQDFVFSSKKKPDKKISRETLTKEINNHLKLVAHQMNDFPVWTSYPFRQRYFTSMWLDLSEDDIKFMHRTISED